MEIVKAKLEDLEAIVELNKQFHIEVPDFIYDNHDWVTEEIREGNYYVLKEGEEVLGAIDIVMHVADAPETEAYIQTLATASHGKGAGTKLIEFAQQKAREAGKKTLTLQSYHELEQRQFYLNRGFRLDEASSHLEGDHPFDGFVKDLPHSKSGSV